MKLKIDKSKFWGRFPYPRWFIRQDRVVRSPVRVSRFALHFTALACLALLLAFLLCSFLDGLFAARTMQVQMLLSQAVSERTTSIFSAVAATPNNDITFSAFNAAEKSPNPVGVVRGEEEKKEAAPIDSFRLVGTISPVAAWVTVDNVTSLVLENQEFKGYTLSEVAPGRVVFSLDDDRHTLYLNYSTNQPSPPPARSRQIVAAPPPEAVDSGQGENIQNAEFNGQDGTIGRELLHNLLMNPYTELGKLRLVPTSSGMVVRSMRPDSLLHQLGVKAGDELTGINGISIKDVPSVMNAINSMMTGARLDFDVVRDEEPGKLGYVVK